MFYFDLIFSLKFSIGIKNAKSNASFEYESEKVSYKKRLLT